MLNIIQNKSINSKVISGILLCLIACYHAGTTILYNRFSGFNYPGLSLTLLFAFIGVLNIKQIDVDSVFKKHKPLQTIMMVTMVVLFLYLFINALNKKKQPTLEEMYKIEQGQHA